MKVITVSQGADLMRVQGSRDEQVSRSSIDGNYVHASSLGPRKVAPTDLGMPCSGLSKMTYGYLIVDNR